MLHGKEVEKQVYVLGQEKTVAEEYQRVGSGLFNTVVCREGISV